MTIDDRAMTVLERANPVPPDHVPDVAIGAARYLEDLQQRSSTVTIRSTESEPTRRSGPRMAIAASVVALLVASIALVIAARDDATVVDQPDPTPPPTIPPTVPPVTTTPIDVGASQLVVDEFVDAHSAWDTDAVMSLIADGATVTRQRNTDDPSPDDRPLGRSDIENHFAWEHAQNNVVTQPACELADEQLSGGTTLSCRWEALEPLAQAADGEGIPTTALVVVSDGQIDQLHLGTLQRDWSSKLLKPFLRWAQTYHDVVDGIDCCEGDTRQESEQRGALRAEWAQEWDVWLDRFECASASCPWTPQEWAAEYDTMCLALDPVGQPTSEFAEVVWLLPRPVLSAPFDAATELATVDRLLAGGGLFDSQVAELQQQRLDAMIEVGIDEACHPTVG